MSSTGRKGLQAVLIIVGAAMIVLGILGGEPAAMLRKAIFVCLECIGIG